MANSRRAAIPVFLAFVLCLGTGAQVAHADDWSDARSAFKKALKSDEWKVRAAAFGELAYFDGTKAVQEILKAVSKEKNEAVLLSAVKSLQAFVTEEARVELAKQLAKAKGTKLVLLMQVFERQEGNHGLSTLMKLLSQDKNLSVKGLAALTLATRQVKSALEQYIQMLTHKDWHVRSAGAWALRLAAGPIPPKPTKQGEKRGPWVPEWYPKDRVMVALAEALAKGTGAERRAILQALTRIGKADFGYAPNAWQALAAGTPVDEIEPKLKPVPYFFGIPVFGERVAIVMTINHRLSEPHPYSDRKRLQELCEVPGARSVPYPRMKTNRHFMSQHVIRTVKDLPGGTRFNLWLAGQKVEPIFGSTWVSASRSSAQKVEEELLGLKTDAGNDAYTSLTMALDAGGAKDGAAWSKGPDEVLYVTCAVPWLAEVTDQQVIGSAVGLKARRRLVPIVAVGVHEHPYELMDLLAQQSGGIYLSLER